MNQNLSWSLNGTVTVTVGFYRDLHTFLRKWPPTRSATKTSIGKFYLSIDPELRLKTSCGRPDNIYLFIQKVANSNKPNSAPMTYGLSVTVTRLCCVIKGYMEDVQEMTMKASEREEELIAMRKEVEQVKTDLSQTRGALEDVTNQLQASRKQHESARKQTQKTREKFDAAVTDFVHYEEQLLTENEELSDLICSLKQDIQSLSSSTVSLVGSFSKTDSSINFRFETKDGGKVYTPAIRELYYTLLAEQIPPGKIASTIKATLKCFLPSLDVQHLKLPQESCASYMRRQELTTVNLAHKASLILQQAESGALGLNSDGTTLSQRKLQGVAINGMVLSVNEVADGSAETMIKDISEEFVRLRTVAHALHYPNADKINWTLIASSSSDSASTQKKFNRLVEIEREKDEERFGAVCHEALDLVENFCAMHLGVNLRKAFLDGVKTVTSVDPTDCTRQRDNPQADVVVHEFCKLLGKHGVPEYGAGVLVFPDFLEEMCTTDTEPGKASYYENCMKVQLDRQVGSRYFVTASNAGKVLFLRDAAVHFLEFTGRNEGNKLEQSLCQKLHDLDVLSQLRADAIMFHHVYSNLTMLAKSTHLDKSALDMSKHYFELQLFLEEVVSDPATAMEKDLRVFPSEGQLYGDNKKINYRLRPVYAAIEDMIFTEDESQATLLYPLLVAGASAMKEKLRTYAQNQLPGGRYWEPEKPVQEILKKLKPTNDLCESILGLNDYLSAAIPNMQQMSRANLIQVKKNKTMTWFHQLSSREQKSIVHLAMKRRAEVARLDKAAASQRSKARREKMVRDNCRRRALKQRATLERERLTMLPVITSVRELQIALSKVDNEPISAANKAKKKRSLIREQIDIRKKVLQQKINIPFSKNKRQRSVTELVQELSDFIVKNPCPNTQQNTESASAVTADSLVGKKVLHKFEVNTKEQWFTGFVVSYDKQTHLHEVVYDGEEEHYFFDLLQDLSEGDLLLCTS